MKLEDKHAIFIILSPLISRKIWWTGKFLNFHTVHAYLVHPNCFKQWAHNHKTFFSILQVLFSTRQCYPARQFYPRQKQSPSKVVSKCKYIWTKPPISWKWDLLSKHASTTLVFSLEKFLTELKCQVRNEKKTFIFPFSIVKKQPDFSAFNLNEMCWKFSTSYERNATVSQKHNVIAETKWRKLRSFDFGGSRSRTNIHLSIITFPQKVLTTCAGPPVHTIHTTTTVNLFKLRQSRSCHYVWLHQNRFVPPIIMVSRAFHI